MEFIGERQPFGSPLVHDPLPHGQSRWSACYWAAWLLLNLGSAVGGIETLELAWIVRKKRIWLPS